jgi:RecA/RadA recombinase
MNRIVVYEGNNPMLIFDRIEKNLASDVEDGMPLRYIIIDSVSGVLGRRELDSDTIETQQIGDHALTVQTGLKRILPTIRKHKIATTLITQVRAEMDQAALKRDPSMKVKMNASFGLQHFAEYFVYVHPVLNKDGRSDYLKREFIDNSVTDLMDKGERTGHKMRVIMKDSSMGPKGRAGMFTFDYKRGVINVHEEVFQLGVNRNVIDCPSQGWYEFGGKKWHGAKDMLKALEESPDLQTAIIKELKARDLRGDYRAMDVGLENDLADVEAVPE